ncbi:hypothetical protein PG989_006523 [Apiospora arundinis]
MAAANGMLVQIGLTVAQQEKRHRICAGLKDAICTLDDAALDEAFAACETKFLEAHWVAGSSTWAVNVDYFRDAVLKTVHAKVHGGVKAKPLDLGEPKITFGAPFSHEVLEWCYNKALDTKALYMAAHGAFKNLSEVTLRRKDRVAMWKSGQVPGLVHDYQVCPQPGMVWIPQIGQVCFESCVGADTQRARSVLDEAMKLVCGRDLVLAYGVLPNDHKALVVEFAADADAESVAVRLQYRQVLLDLLQWQTRLLRGEVVVLDESLRGILGARLQAGARAQPPRGLLEERQKLLRRYWCHDSQLLVAAQNAAITAAARQAADTLFDNVQGSDEKAHLDRLFTFVATTGHRAILPVAERQAMVKDKAKPYVLLHIMRLWTQGAGKGKLEDMVNELVEFVRADEMSNPMTNLLTEEQRAKHGFWATISPPRDRWELMVQNIGDLDLLNGVERALACVEAELRLDPLLRIQQRMDALGIKAIESAPAASASAAAEPTAPPQEEYDSDTSVEYTIFSPAAREAAAGPSNMPKATDKGDSKRKRKGKGTKPTRK